MNVKALFTALGIFLSGGSSILFLLILFTFAGKILFGIIFGVSLFSFVLFFVGFLVSLVFCAILTYVCLVLSNSL